MPVYAADGGAAGAAIGSAAAGAANVSSQGKEEKDSDFGDDSSKSSDDKGKLDELGDLPATRPPKEDDGQVADIGKAAIDAAAKAPTPQTAAIQPQAAPIKQEIQAALARNDGPAARQLMGQALRRFPNDPELKDARSSLWSHLPEEKARAIINSAYAEAAKLFGREWIPGKSADEVVSLSVEDPRRGTTPAFGGPPVTSALNRGYGYLEQGDISRAEQVLSKAIKRNEGAAALYYARAMTRGLSGDFKGADGDSLRAVTLSHQQAVTLSQRAALMMESGRRDEAFAWANRALLNDPKDADSLAVRGRYLWKDQGRPELAIEDLKRAAQIDPGRYQALYQEGQRRFYSERAAVSVGKGDYRQAFADAGRVLEADAGNVQAHLVRGLVCWKLGNVEGTIKDTTLALKANPRSTRALFQRGLAMEALGQRDRAIADFRRAAAINPVKYGPLLNRLLDAKREGQREPVWPREGGIAAVSN